MLFNKQPDLKGTLLEIRPLRETDFDDLLAVASDPLIWEQHPAKDRYKKDIFRNLFKESFDSGGALVIIDSKTGKIIGSSRYHAYNNNKSEIEIGWTFLARRYWGGTYNLELKELMLEHAFKFVKSVIFLVGLKNFRSQKAMEKIGGVKSGIRIDSNGNESIIYRITVSPHHTDTANS